MRRFKVLCILLISVFFISLGWNIADDIITVEHSHGTWEAPFRALHDRSHTCVNVESKEPVRELNRISGDTIYVIENNVTIFEYSDELFKISGSLKALEVVLDVVMWLLLVFFIYLVVQFVKVIRSFTHSKVFEPQVIKRINRIGVGFIIMSVVSSLWNWGMTYLIQQLIDIERLNVVYRSIIEWDNLLMGLIIIVMNEILRQALSMKEENDLTI